MPRKTPRLTGEEANFRQLYYVYQRAAKKKGRTFKLSIEQFREITKQNCYICGTPPAREYRHSLKLKMYAEPYVANGVDRLENTRGYEVDNSVPCCKTCNLAKGTKSIEEYLLYIYDAYKFSIEPSLKEGVPQDEHKENKQRRSKSRKPKRATKA